MTTKHLIDKDLLAGLDLMPTIALSNDMLPLIRDGFESRRAEAPPGLFEPSMQSIRSANGGSDLGVLVFEPAMRKSTAAILHIHGGGMVLGSADLARLPLPYLCEALGVLAVSVDYRLAPETCFPGPQEDCYAALQWMTDNADLLGIDANHIIIMGESAGGGLAAAVTHMVRDRGALHLAGQVLIYPMLDHRTGGPDCPWRNPMTGEFVWTRQSNQFGWNALRGQYSADDDEKGWFSPSLAGNLADLPPAFIAVGALDLFLDEDLDYARRLIAAGVSVEAHVYAGAYHGFNVVPEAPVSQAAQANMMAALFRMTQ